MGVWDAAWFEHGFCSFGLTTTYDDDDDHDTIHSLR